MPLLSVTARRNRVKAKVFFVPKLAIWNESSYHSKQFKDQEAGPGRKHSYSNDYSGNR